MESGGGSVGLDVRPLGRTGLTVTRIGLGLAALGRPAYINLQHGEDLGPDRTVESLERRTHEVLDAALDAGVRYFDAARSYGLAESFLASWLNRLREPDVVTVGSKWGYTYVGEWKVDVESHEIKDHSVAALRRQIKESRQLLGPRLKLYQIHSATLETGVLEDNAVLGELVQLREQGIVVGISTSGPRQDEAVQAALNAEVNGVNPFGCVQSTWNVLDPSAGGALATARSEGWGVIVKEAVANGRLAIEHPYADGSERTPLQSLADDHSVSPDAVAIAAALAQPWADVVLSGAVTVDQLRSNLTAVDVQLSEEDRDRLDRMAEEPTDYWTKRAGLRWN
jgi:aryl-alcohol dehydrogenase-like predicted oxidoreductase